MKQNISHLLFASGMSALLLSVPVHANNLMDQVGQGIDKARQLQQARGHKGQEESYRDHRHDHDRGQGCSSERNLRSLQGSEHTSVRFVNDKPFAVRTYWLDYNGRRVFYKQIPAGGSHVQPTYRTHPWVITDERDQCLQIFVSERSKDEVRIAR